MENQTYIIRRIKGAWAVFPDKKDATKQPPLAGFATHTEAAAYIARLRREN